MSFSRHFVPFALQRAAIERLVVEWTHLKTRESEIRTLIDAIQEWQNVGVSVRNAEDHYRSLRKLPGSHLSSLRRLPRRSESATVAYLQSIHEFRRRQRFKAVFLEKSSQFGSFLQGMSECEMRRRQRCAYCVKQKELSEDLWCLLLSPTIPTRFAASAPDLIMRWFFSEQHKSAAPVLIPAPLEENLLVLDDGAVAPRVEQLQRLILEHVALESMESMQQLLPAAACDEAASFFPPDHALTAQLLVENRSRVQEVWP